MKSDEELLKTPLKDLNKEDRARAFSAYDRKIAKIDAENRKFKKKTKPGGTYFTSDCIEALNPADGKMYSSRSRYYEALKNTGTHVVETGEHGKKRETQGDYNLKTELKQALQQHLGR